MIALQLTDDQMTVIESCLELESLANSGSNATSEDDLIFAEQIEDVINEIAKQRRNQFQQSCDGGNKDTTPSCKERVKEAFKNRMANIRQLYKAEYDPESLSKKKLEEIKDELGRLDEYGLCLDLVPAGTFEKQRENYKRYQLSWGGPAEEFRVYENGEVEFWFLDWFDGACVPATGEDAEIIKNITDAISWHEES